MLLALQIVGCSVEIMPAHKSDDGYADLTTKDKSRISAFSYSSLTPSDNRWLNSDSVEFQYINSGDVKTNFQKSDYSLVMLVTTWCAHCVKDVASLNRMQQLFEKYNIKPYVVYQNFNISFIQKIFVEYKIPFPVNFISSDEYGTVQNQKGWKLMAELGDTLTRPNMFPRNYLFGSDGKLLAVKGSALLNPDTLHAVMNKIKNQIQ